MTVGALLASKGGIHLAKKAKKAAPQNRETAGIKSFLDMIAPAAIKFNTDHFILGSRYHTAMALKSYPPMTDELALLRGLGDMGGVNLRLTARQVTPAEEDAILHAATNKSRMERSNTNDYKQSVTAEANLRDMAELLAKQRQEKEPLIHCGVYLDIAATDTEKLRTARDTVMECYFEPSSMLRYGAAYTYPRYDHPFVCQRVGVCCLRYSSTLSVPPKV